LWVREKEKMGGAVVNVGDFVGINRPGGMLLLGNVTTLKAELDEDGGWSS